MNVTLPIQFPGEPTAPAPHHGRVLRAALEILDQGADLLRAVSLQDYTTRVPMAFNGTIGGHYRHCVDHFASLLRSLESGLVDYDARERDRRIEADTGFALALTETLRRQLAGLNAGQLEAPVRTRCEVSYAQGDSPITSSTLARELAYAIAHAIHHFALISVMAKLAGVTLPQHFGIAPSTVAHQAKTFSTLAA